MLGWIVYDREVASLRTWYINKYIEAFKSLEIDFKLVTEDEINTCLEAAKPDFAIVRLINPGLSRRLENMGIRCFNQAKVSEICNDKKKTYEFVGENTKVPYMEFGDIAAAEPVTFPCVIKAKAGHGGTQVHWCNNREDFNQLMTEKLDSGESLEDYIWQQPCNNLGVDVRVYILGGKVVAAMKRENGLAGSVVKSEEKFLSNYCLGGKASRYELETDPLMKSYTEEILKALSLDFAGIDFIFNDDKPVFNEIEDVVGARMLYDLTDIDIVQDYAEYIMQVIRYTEGEKDE